MQEWPNFMTGWSHSVLRFDRRAGQEQMAGVLFLPGEKKTLHWLCRKHALSPRVSWSFSHNARSVHSPLRTCLLSGSSPLLILREAQHLFSRWPAGGSEGLGPELFKHQGTLLGSHDKQMSRQAAGEISLFGRNTRDDTVQCCATNHVEFFGSEI